MAKKKEIIWTPLLENSSKKPSFQVGFSPKDSILQQILEKEPILVISKIMSENITMNHGAIMRNWGESPEIKREKENLWTIKNSFQGRLFTFYRKDAPHRYRGLLWIILKGMVLKSFTLKPTKPNSGNRKVCKVRLANGAVRIGQFYFEVITVWPLLYDSSVSLWP